MADTDWQARKSLAETNLFMLEKEVACDVTFLVGDQKEAVKAHKFMLVSRSCVFYAMLQGSMAETTDHIAIPDIDRETFTLLLRFLYCEDTTISADSVMSLLYAGKKYGVEALVDMCGEFLAQNMNVDTVCTIFNQASQFDEEALKETSLSFILKNGEDVLQSPGFLTLVPDCLRSVLESDLLDANEELVYTASMKWSVEECHRRKLEVSHENQREVLGDLLYLIRFPIMTLEFFTNIISVDTVLEDYEKVALFQCLIANNGGHGSKFCNRERITRKELKVERFGAVESSWTFHGPTDAISFTCSKKARLLGVSVYTSLTGQRTGTIRVFDENLVELFETSINVAVTESRTMEVMFDKPVGVSKGKIYHIVESCRGSLGWNGKRGKKHVHMSPDDVTVSFIDSEFSANGTTVREGQIPALLLEV